MLGSNHVVKNSSYVPVLHDFTYRLISIDKASRTFETRGGTLPSSDADRSLDQCYHLIPFFFWTWSKVEFMAGTFRYLAKYEEQRVQIVWWFLDGQCVWTCRNFETRWDGHLQPANLGGFFLLGSGWWLVSCCCNCLSLTISPAGKCTTQGGQGQWAGYQFSLIHVIFCKIPQGTLCY